MYVNSISNIRHLTQFATCANHYSASCLW